MEAQKPHMYNDIEKSLPLGMIPSALFAIVACAFCLLPSVGIFWAENTGNIEKTDLAPEPALIDDSGHFNSGILADVGAWFEDHFAYRANYIDANDRLYSTLFGISPTRQVIVGNDSWLYYGGTLNDYQNRTPLRARQAHNIACNIRIIQDYCEATGARFAFTIAPNKNTIYPANMPYYYPEVENASMEVLNEKLASQSVNYINLFDVLKSGAERATAPLYFKGDSHWNGAGALLAHDSIMTAVEADSLDLAIDDLSPNKDYIGDLELMLYPTSATSELNWYAEGINDGSGESATQRSGSAWSFIKGNSVEDPEIITEPNENNVIESATETATEYEPELEPEYEDENTNRELLANGTLLMFRDSFGNSLIPYLACEFDQARFSKMIPYNLLDISIDKPSVIILERAQRHVDYLAEEAPLMPSPVVDSMAFDRAFPNRPAYNGKTFEYNKTSEDDMPTVDTVAADAMLPTLEIIDNDPLFTLSGSTGAGAGASYESVYIRITEVPYDSKINDRNETSYQNDEIDKISLQRTYQSFLISNDTMDDGFAVHISRELWRDKTARIEIFTGTPENFTLIYSRKRIFM